MRPGARLWIDAASRGIFDGPARRGERATHRARPTATGTCREPTFVLFLVPSR